ncbi:hypothetical protein FRC11_007383 [Ceratobasidium sp. 423]|nr:hypothetical protein FRC11_007383 [Ceratobasidium sp. 423]
MARTAKPKAFKQTPPEAAKSKARKPKAGAKPDKPWMLLDQRRKKKVAREATKKGRVKILRANAKGPKQQLWREIASIVMPVQYEYDADMAAAAIKDFLNTFRSGKGDGWKALINYAKTPDTDDESDDESTFECGGCDETFKDEAGLTDHCAWFLPIFSFVHVECLGRV